MIRFEMKNCNAILTEKQLKMSAWSSGKIDKNEHVTGEEILLSNQRQITKQAKFTYSPFGKASKKSKTIEKEGEKQIIALENGVERKLLGTYKKSIGSLFSKDFLN